VCRRSVLLVRTAEANVGANHNNGGSIPLFAGSVQGRGDRIDVVTPFNLLDMPAESCEARHTIFCEGQLCAAFDGDVVVGIQDDQLAQPQVTSIGSGFGRDPFLQVPIAH